MKSLRVVGDAQGQGEKQDVVGVVVPWAGLAECYAEGGNYGEGSETTGLICEDDSSDASCTTRASWENKNSSSPTKINITLDRGTHL